MSKIIAKRHTGSDYKQYLRLEDADFIWDRDIGMADHWGDDFITALLTVLSLMYGEGHIITVHSVPEPKFKVGCGNARLKDGVIVNILKVIPDGNEFCYKIEVPFAVSEQYLREIT